MRRVSAVVLLAIVVPFAYALAVIIAVAASGGTPLSYLIENRQPREIELIVDGTSLGWQGPCSRERYFTRISSAPTNYVLVRDREGHTVYRTEIQGHKVNNLAKIRVEGTCDTMQPVVAWWAILGGILLAIGVVLFIGNFLPIRRIAIRSRAKRVALGLFSTFLGFVLLVHWLFPGAENDLTMVACVPALGMTVSVILFFRMLSSLEDGRKAILRFQVWMNDPTGDNSKLRRWLRGRRLPGWVKRYYDID